MDIQKDATFMIMSLSIQESGTTPNHRARLINSQDRFANKWQVVNQTILQTFQRCFNGYKHNYQSNSYILLKSQFSPNVWWASRGLLHASSDLLGWKSDLEKYDSYWFWPHASLPKLLWIGNHTRQMDWNGINMLRMVSRGQCLYPLQRPFGEVYGK